MISLFENQLQKWPSAKKRYEELEEVKTRRIHLVPDYEIVLQYNPARIISTGADIKKESINRRPCFLCENNRPIEQENFEIKKGWQLLVNPFPIFKPHFTIVSSEHKEQGRIPKEILEFANIVPGMTVFFNGALAGASAPDHLHLQAVKTDFLPLMKFVENVHTLNDKKFMSSAKSKLDFPYIFFSGIKEKNENRETFYDNFLNFVLNESIPLTFSHEKCNAFAWEDKNGILRFVIVPRDKHRPDSYYKEGVEKRLISPGAIDMAGTIILPRKEDFENLNRNEILEIYRQAGISFA